MSARPIAEEGCPGLAPALRQSYLQQCELGGADTASRRSFLQLAGAAAMGGIIPSCHLPGRITFGSNSEAWRTSASGVPGFSAAVPLAGVVRVYWHGTNHIGATWPRYDHARVVLSLEPRPSDLLAGKLDAQFLRLAATAPRGSMLVPWYEAGPANPRDYYAYANATNVRACQGYLHRLLRPTNVRVGSIICGPATQLEDWIAPGLDWYGVDIDGDWFRSGETFEVARFQRRQEENLAVWRRKARGRVHLVVGESNCGLDEVRAPWFELLAGWLARQRLRAADICTFWAAPSRHKHDNDKPPAAESAGRATGPWPPSDHTIDVLRALSARYGPAVACPWGDGAPPAATRRSL